MEVIYIFIHFYLFLSVYLCISYVITEKPPYRNSTISDLCQFARFRHERYTNCANGRLNFGFGAFGPCAQIDGPVDVPVDDLVDGPVDDPVLAVYDRSVFILHPGGVSIIPGKDSSHKSRIGQRRKSRIGQS